MGIRNVRPTPVGDRNQSGFERMVRYVSVDEVFLRAAAKAGLEVVGCQIMPHGVTHATCVRDGRIISVPTAAIGGSFFTPRQLGLADGP